MYTNHVNPVALQTQDRFTTTLFALMEQKPLGAQRIGIKDIALLIGADVHLT